MKKSILCKDTQLKDARIYEIVEKLKKEYNFKEVVP
jgi:hypothetical protein